LVSTDTWGASNALSNVRDAAGYVIGAGLSGLNTGYNIGANVAGHVYNTVGTVYNAANFVTDNALRVNAYARLFNEGVRVYNAHYHPMRGGYEHAQNVINFGPDYVNNPNYQV